MPPIDELDVRYRAKEEIRRRVKAIRRALPASARAERSARVADRVLSLSSWSAATTVAGYVAMGGEVDVMPLLERLRAEGKRAVLPRVEPGAETFSLHVAGPDDLEDSGYGFRQPAAHAPPVSADEVDLVLVPAVAVDERGHRLGHGRGFYDRFVATAPRAVLVVVAYDFQLLMELPDTPGDEPAHWVVTDQRVLRGVRPFAGEPRGPAGSPGGGS